MALKRKRSVDDSPLSISSFGAVSTPEAQSPTPFPHGFDGSMDLDVDTASRPNAWDFMSASRVKNSDWGNRTRKRFRDNRPDERAIHENTLNKLFAAQRQHPDASPIPSETLPPQQPSQAAVKPQKSTLHSFWKQLPAPPVQPLSFAVPTPVQQEMAQGRCEDCDTLLRSDNESMDVDVDMDMGGAVASSSFACSDCGKSVCGTCAVVSNRRHCLQCATSGRNSRRWW
ncbi:Nn.00g032530.m01.CDS01 [Neocucurbitaria sp. VM-36]